MAKASITTTELTKLGAQINRVHRLAERAGRSAVQHATHAGEMLIKAKRLCRHGTWQSWLADHCEVSERSARLYMQVARDLPEADRSKRQRVAILSLREAVTLLAEPREPITQPAVKITRSTIRLIKRSGPLPAGVVSVPIHIVEKPRPPERSTTSMMDTGSIGQGSPLQQVTGEECQRLALDKLKEDAARGTSAREETQQPESTECEPTEVEVDRSPTGEQTVGQSPGRKAEPLDEQSHNLVDALCDVIESDEFRSSVPSSQVMPVLDLVRRKQEDRLRCEVAKQLKVVTAAM